MEEKGPTKEKVYSGFRRLTKKFSLIFLFKVDSQAKSWILIHAHRSLWRNIFRMTHRSERKGSNPDRTINNFEV